MDRRETTSFAVPAMISRFEGSLLTIVRAALGVASPESASRHVFALVPAPPGLSPAAVQLLCDDLSRGCVQLLAKSGGWRHERFLRDGKAVEGRLWQRSPIDEIKWAFSRQIADFLFWVAANHPTKAKPWEPDAEAITVADQFVIFQTYEAFRGTEAGPPWRRQAAFRLNPLCRLAYPEDFTGQPMEPDVFAPWVSGLGGAILEGLQRRLTDRWLALERGKSEIADWSAMRSLGESQDAVLQRYGATIHAAGRRDLARFLLRATCVFCHSGLRAAHLIGGLRGGNSLRLAQRIDVRRRAGSLLRFFTESLAGWEREARATGYLDEGYAAAQLFLADWEAAGATAALSAARAVLNELVPVTEGAAS